MRGKDKSLLYLITSLVLLVVIIAVMIAVPRLRNLGEDLSQKAISRLNNLDNSAISVTSAPYALPDYMWDAEIYGSQPVNLRPLISSTAMIFPDILNDTGLRIRVGQEGRAYTFSIYWDTGISETALTITLFDRLERPLEYASRSSGVLITVVPGGLYKVGISSDGKLGEGFALKATAEPTSQQPDFDNPGPLGIPTIDIQMSDAIYRTWDIQRDKLYKEISKTEQWIDTSNFKKVLANIVIDNISHKVQLWEAGSGDPVHFSPDTPSFTGSVISGPLLYGMSKFKLYSIRTQEGLMNYVIESIMSDEGIFVPRFLLSNVTLNDKPLGLYLLVETPDSDGFFSGVLRYSGTVTDWTGGLPIDPLPADGLASQQPLSELEMNDPSFAGKTEARTLAKSLALVSRFLATHALSESDLRWYRNPYLDSPEPVLRDLNAGMMSEAQIGDRSLLIHTGWWLGPRLSGSGPNYNAKVFPMDKPYDPYVATPTSLNLASVDTKPYHFVRTAQNRELFEQYLLYASDNSFQQKLEARIKSVSTAVVPFLDDGSKRPMPEHSETFVTNNITSEIDWLKWQTEEGLKNERMLPRDVPQMMLGSALLVSPLQTEDKDDNITVSLYNLSPFSARIKLPDYTSVSGEYPMEVTGYKEDGRFLAPSLLFPDVVSISSSTNQKVTDPSKLDRNAAARLLILERLYYLTRGVPEVSMPFIDVTIPAARYNDFVSFLSTASLVTLGDFYTLPPQRNLLLNDLPVKIPSSQTLSSSTADNPDIIILPLGMEQISPRVTRLSLLITNYSADNVSLELNDLRWTDTEDSSNEIPRSLHAVWQLGDTPEKLTITRVNLGASAYNPGLSGSILDSPMLWTGALAGYINGSANAALPDAVMVQYDFSILETTSQWIQTDGNPLVKSAVSSKGAILVAIHEPFRVYLPGQNTKTQQLAGYRSPGTSSRITVSSYYKGHVKSNLADGNTDTIWHVKFPLDTTRHWVRFDFGAPLTVEGIAVLPHFKLIGQMWDKDHAVLQGSNDPITRGWTNLAYLSNDKATLLSQDDRGWLVYSVPNNTAYRYSRLFIDDSTFLSLAEVKFKVKEWQPPPEISVAQLLAQGILVEKETPDSSRTLVFSGKDLVIPGMIIIPKGYVFKIEPGTTIKFTEDAGIISYSPIEAVGTMENPITLGPEEAGKSWRGIAVVGTAVASDMEYVTMTGAAAGSAGKVQFTDGLTFMKTRVKLVNVSLLDFTSEDGLHLSNSFFDITGLSIQNGSSDGLDSDWSCGTISDSQFNNNTGDGIDLSGSRATIINCTSKENNDKGISIGEGSVARIFNASVLNNRTGVAVKDQSAVTITGSVITGNRYGVLQYIKKPVFIFPTLFLDNNEINNNETNTYKEDPGTWTRAFD